LTSWVDVVNALAIAKLRIAEVNFEQLQARVALALAASCEKV
jgi:hypothetical protein